MLIQISTSQSDNELVIEILQKLGGHKLKPIIISGDNYAHVTTAGLSWHVHNYDLI